MAPGGQTSGLPVWAENTSPLSESQSPREGNRDSHLSSRCLTAASSSEMEKNGASPGEAGEAGDSLARIPQPFPGSLSAWLETPHPSLQARLSPEAGLKAALSKRSMADHIIYVILTTL